MPSVELSKVLGLTPARPVADSEQARPGARLAAAAPPPAPAPAPASEAPLPAGIRLEIGATPGASLDPATPPVDADRVAKIRAALRDGSYPLVPTRIADALIAAQVSFALPAAEPRQ